LLVPPGPPPFVALRLRKVGGDENAMSDFSSDAKPGNNRCRFAVRLAYPLAANSNSSSPSRTRLNGGGDLKEQE
jgi:hypothetical protein